MATPTNDYPGLISAVGAALTALEANDWLTARLKAVEAQFIILGLGNSATANGANLQLSIDTVESIIKNIEALQIYQAAVSGNGRRIRTLFSDGRVRGNGNVLHD